MTDAKRCQFCGQPVDAEQFILFDGQPVYRCGSLDCEQALFDACRAILRAYKAADERVERAKKQAREE